MAEGNPFKAITGQKLASFIQSTRIAPDSRREEIIQHVEECAAYQFNAAMVAMCWVPLAKEILTGTGVLTATFFGYGLGNESMEGKVALIKECRRLGADQVDYAPNMGYFLSGMYAEFRDEAARLVAAAEGMPVKAMLQLGFIETEPDKRLAAQLLDEGGLPWIKNSSGGWAPGSTPATPEDIRLLRSTVSPQCRIKASGKINNVQTALALLEAGAELLGTSSGPEIIAGLENNQNDY